MDKYYDDEMRDYRMGVTCSMIDIPGKKVQNFNQKTRKEGSTRLLPLQEEHFEMGLELIL
jgi:hypothetical protein